jgi:serine/threonine protein kinase/tetratricopeptide (TPR) repeat protein
MAAEPADRNLLFGLLALQNGLIDQDQLLTAFRAWTRDKSRPLAELLVDRGELDGDDRAAVEALVARHIKKHGDIESSLAAVPTGRSTRAQLGAVGDPEVEASLIHVGSGSTEPEDRTATYAVGIATSDGQRFRVLRPHARGGLGAVFVALDEELHREVALKQILDQHADDPASRSRFLLEAEITGGLEHPGIVPVYGLGTHGDGRPYYAMRFIRGDSLKEAIERFHADEGLKRDPGRRSLELSKLLRRFLDVCNAIDYAHSRGVLHRDIKPGNVIVGRYGETLVVDWGLAKALGRREPGTDTEERTLAPSSANGSAETLPGSALGTPAYMSPEQAAGDLDRMGARSDVYSLGATLYSILTGRPAFESDDVGEVLRRVHAGEFPAPRKLEPAIDPALEAVCLKAMSQQPAGRYATPKALADDVELWMADEPVTAWRETLARRARRWARRHRPAVAGAAASLLVGVAGLIAVVAVQARANAGLTAANNTAIRALAEARAAKLATDRALAESEESRRKAEAVSTFLVESFRSPDPSQDGREVRVADLLDRAVEALDKEFTGTAATQGALLQALGRTYFGLGLYDKSEATHAKARAVRETALGPHHPDTLTSRSELADAYQEGGRTTEAIRLHEETLKLRESKLGADHPDTIMSRSSLASAYWAGGRTTEAIRLHEETLKLRESKLGRDHADTIHSRNELALAYLAVGRAEEAALMHEETLKFYTSKLGPDHPNTLLSRNNLALDYWAAGRTTEAIQLHEGTLLLSESKLGPDHPNTLLIRGNLADAYQAAGRTTEAIGMYEEAFKRYGLRLGPNHPSTVSTGYNLAAAYLSAGQTTEATRLHEEMLRRSESKLAPEHVYTLASRYNLAAAYESLGRWADAEPLRRDILARRRRAEKPENPSVAFDLSWLGRNLLNQARWSEAEAVLRECLMIREKAIPDDWSRFNAMSLLGDALLGQGEFAAAEGLVVSGFEGMKVREAKMPAAARPRLAEAAERVVRLYEAWGKPEQAAAWKAKLGLADLPADVFSR